GERGEDRGARSRAAAGGCGDGLDLSKSNGIHARRLWKPQPGDLLADDLVLYEDREHRGAEGGVVGALTGARDLRRATGCDRALVAGIVHDRAQGGAKLPLGDLGAVDNSGVGRETDVAPREPEH